MNDSIKKIFNNQFEGKTVMITGHTGFKGAWLSLWLTELGANVVGVSLNPPSNPNFFDSTNLKENMIDIRADIRNYETIYEVIKKHNPEIIFHLAAQALVKCSYEDPLETYNTNIIGTANILEAVRHLTSVKAIINVTTDKCYENKENEEGYKENDKLGGYDPYSSSKACSEIITSSFRNSFFNLKDYGTSHNVLIATVRAGNIIGGGDWGEYRLIPDCVKAISNNKTIKIRNPNSIRPWQHVLEPLSGYLFIGSLLLQGKKEFATGWNLGPDDKKIITVEEIVKILIESWNKGDYIIELDKKHHEANLLMLNVDKAKSEIGWHTIYNYTDAVKKTVEWYKQFYKLENMKKFSINQITEYILKAKDNKLSWCN